MAGSDTGAIVAVEVFVEEDVVAPVRIILEELDFSVERSSAIGPALENRNERVFEVRVKCPKDSSAVRYRWETRP